MGGRIAEVQFHFICFMLIFSQDMEEKQQLAYFLEPAMGSKLNPNEVFAMGAMTIAKMPYRTSLQV